MEKNARGLDHTSVSGAGLRVVHGKRIVRPTLVVAGKNCKEIRRIRNNKFVQTFKKNLYCYTIFSSVLITINVRRIQLLRLMRNFTVEIKKKKKKLHHDDWMNGFGDG